MKKAIFTITILILFRLPLPAETIPPQIAYRMLDDFITEKEISQTRNNRIGGGITMGIGGLLMAASASLYLWGDDIFAEDTDWIPDTRNITCVSLAGGGLVTFGVGTVLLLAPPKDYRNQYRNIYGEADPVVQEALAAGALYQLADEGRRERITAGVTNLATPIVFALITITSNMLKERHWSDNVTESTLSLSWNLVTGITQLFFDKSEEEEVYARYQETKKALLVRN